MPSKPKNKWSISLILDNIRSIHNVGSIFRTAECAGVSRIFCVGTTPVPLDRFGCKRKDFAKVSLGAEDMLEWEHFPDREALGMVGRLKKDGFEIVAVEQGNDSIDYREARNMLSGNFKKLVLILGNEVSGVSRKFLRVADMVTQIPINGRKESLNVSVAAGIILFSFV